MHLQTRQLRLILEAPFTLAHGSSTVRDNVLVQLRHGSHTGTGEAAVVPYRGDSAEEIIAYLEAPRIAQALVSAPCSPPDVIDQLPDGPTAARAALDMALHDLWGQQLGQPLYAIWGLNPERCPQSSFTVAMEQQDDLFRQRLRAACDHSIVKLKLGCGDIERDLERVRMARAELRGRLCVDVNAGWSTQEAMSIIPRLLSFDLLFIEQPVPATSPQHWRTLRAGLPDSMPPLIADESVQNDEDIAALAGLVDGINVKLAKCGGLRPARRMIERARLAGMKVLIGCMIESSVGVTAAAHLAPLCDFADLDGNLLVTNDPYRGVRLDRGRLLLPRGAGLGIAPGDR